MLFYWMVIKDGIISNYQVVVLLIWNLGLCNFNDDVGLYEQLLVGMLIVDLVKLLEVVCIIYFFDFCMVCVVYVVDVDGNEVVLVKVL